MRKTGTVLTILLLLAGGLSAAEWQVTEIAAIEGLDVPECLVVDEPKGLVYISNVSTKTEGYWEDDGVGFISLATTGGDLKELHWLNSSPAFPINGPKGMCVLDGKLYFNDNTRLLKCALGVPGTPEPISLPRSKKLNDLGTDGVCVYVTDTELGIIYKIDPRGGAQELKAPEGVNGVTSWKGRLFAVSWTQHEVYELDPQGKQDPRPFGVAEHFTNLDGIEVLEDGTFVVSDFMGNKVSLISPDEKTVTTLLECESPADFGLDRKRGLLLVPELMKNRAVLYKLEKK